MILYKTPSPKKRLSMKRMLPRAAQSPAHACACVQILTCMPAGDSNPTGNLLSSFSVGAQLQGNKHHAEALQKRPRFQCLSVRAAKAPALSQRLSARAAKERQQRTNNNQMVFSFPPEERVPFSQPRKYDGARVATARAPSQRLSARAMRQHNNQKGVIRVKRKRQQRNNTQMVFSFSPEEESAPLSAKER